MHLALDSHKIIQIKLNNMMQLKRVITFQMASFREQIKILIRIKTLNSGIWLNLETHMMIKRTIQNIIEVVVNKMIYHKIKILKRMKEKQELNW